MKKTNTDHTASQASSPVQTKRNPLASIAGVLIFTGAFIWFIVTTGAESVYPGYSVGDHVLSRLGTGPTSTIFNASLVTWGTLAITAACVCYVSRIRAGRKVVTVPLMLFGAALIGVGLFPTHPDRFGVHDLAAFLAFSSGGVIGLLAATATGAPFRYVSAALGGLALIALVLFILEIYLGLGRGGMERMVAFPILTWHFLFGGFLLVQGRAES